MECMKFLLTIFSEKCIFFVWAMLDVCSVEHSMEYFMVLSMEWSQSCCVGLEGGSGKAFFICEVISFSQASSYSYKLGPLSNLACDCFFVIVKHHGQIGLAGTIGVIYVARDAL